MKKNILLIGAGNIGFRHFQSLLISKRELNIFIFDLNQKKYFKLKNYSKKKIFRHKNIFYIKKIRDIFFNVDLVIDARTCQNRFELIKSIIQKTYVKNFLIEKVIFNNNNDFKKLLKISTSKNINIWVNCIRREVNIYQQIKKKIRNNNFEIIYKGSKWGMASNLIHFIDLFDFFSNIKKPAITISCPGFINSKRKGFKELTGFVQIKSENNTMILEDNPKYKKNFLQIKFKNYLYQFNSSYIQIKNINSNKKTIIKNKEENVSYITNIIVENIFNSKTYLSTLYKTYSHHKLLFKIIQKFMKFKKNKNIFYYT